MPISNPTAGPFVTSGQYTGNDAVNRVLPHGLGRSPGQIEIVVKEDGDRFVINKVTPTYIHDISSTHHGRLPVTAMNSTSFYVGNAVSYPWSANENTVVYDWVAVG